jgi:hypothetical protein
MESQVRFRMSDEAALGKRTALREIAEIFSQASTIVVKPP